MDAAGVRLLALRDVPVGILAMDARGECVFANERFCTQSEMEPGRALGWGWLESVHPADRLRVEAVAKDAFAATADAATEYRATRSGEPPYAWLLLQVAPLRSEAGDVVGFVAATFDITIRARAEAERQVLAQRVALADRLASLGTLSAGIGHEINNPLAALFMSLDHACARLEAMKPDGVAFRSASSNGSLAEIEQVVREARIAADRISKIVRGVVNLAPPRDHDSTRECRIQDAIERVLAMSAHAYRSRIEIQRDFGPTPRVLADPIGLSQVFLNLVVNAIEAIQSASGTGVIRVSTHMSDAGEVIAEVEDDGPGVPEDIARRIFDPFFTTKPPGYTGLGLAVSHEIARNLGGTLELLGGRAVGACFRLTLPAAELPSDRADGETPARLRVLIVEEEYGLLIALKRGLGDRFLVATERDAPTALARLRRGERFDAVLLSLMLTDLSTSQLYEAISALDGAQASRVLFLTGLPFSPEIERFAAAYPERHVSLAARPDELQEAVRAAARR